MAEIRRRRRASAFAVAFVGTLCSGLPAIALEPAEQRGLTFAKTHCAMCHSIGRAGTSPLAIAPPLRSLHDRYPVESLAEAFAEGIQTGHPSMPQFQLDSAQISDLIAYLKSLEATTP